MSLRDQLQAIYDEYGELTPQLVVDVAKPKDHPLHNRVYDRSRSDAAEAWYLHRAETLIRKVRVTYTQADGTLGKVRWFHPVRTESPGVYDPLDVIVEDDIAMTVLLRQAEREWRQMQTRYSHLAGFWEIVKQDIA